VIETLQSRDLNDEERSLVLGSLSLAKGTVAYWNAQDDIFDGDIIERGNGKFWADLAGFVSGFNSAMWIDYTLPEWRIPNPFLVGSQYAAMQSALFDKD